MVLCTVFKNFSIPVENKSLLELANEIASSKCKNQVGLIRQLIENGNAEEASIKKQQLSAFTPSATFKDSRTLKNIEKYSGYVHLDFDKMTQEQVESSFKIISQIPYTFLCFRSPSGKGLKVFVEVNTEAKDHPIAYSQVQEMYENNLGFKSDPKCKDITRLCFMSHDPQVYININSQKFEVQKIHEKNYEGALNECTRYTETKKIYKEGNRNDFVYFFASNCNRKGIPEQIALQFAYSRFDLRNKEIEGTFKSAYANHKNEFGSLASFEKLRNYEQSESEEEHLRNTPSIPAELYLHMPEIIKQGAMVFTDVRERDVFLTAALAIISGCLPGVKGVYAGRDVFPGLYTFTIAPPASGKGVLSCAKELADEYHYSTLKVSREKQALYDQKMAQQKQRVNKKDIKSKVIREEVPKPAFEIVFIPANTSYAKILWHLEQNGGVGIICETEADTLGNVFKQDWGSYSDMLRKAFHHERISSSRKTNNEFTEINTPRLSIALSGTFNQVTGLIASSEDGLFSRFIFYVYKVDQEWKDVSPNAHTINFTEHFKKLSTQVFEMVKFLKGQETNIELSSGQWDALNQKCKAWLSDIVVFTSEDAGSVVKRLGLVLYRMAMIFTALRKFENAELTNSLICTDEDFNTACSLAEVYMKHSILMFNNLPKQKEATQFKTGDGKRKLIEQLPAEFNRLQAIELGKGNGLSARTIDNLLKNATGKILKKVSLGRYQKIS